MKNRKLVKVICIIIAAIFILAAFLPLIVHGDNNQTQGSIDNLQTRLAELNRKEAEIERSISAASKKKQSQTQKKIQLDKQINNLEDQIDTQTDLINEYTNKIAEKDALILSLQGKIDVQFVIFQKRVRANFEQGTPTPIAILFGAKNFSDLLTRLEFSELIMSYDKKLISDLKTNKDQVQKVKSEIVQDKTDVQKLKTGLEKSQRSLESKRAESDSIISSLNSDIAEYKKAYEAAEKEEKKVQAEITKLLESLSDSKYVGGDFLWPTPGHTRITCPYGMRLHPILKVYKMHTGVDIGVASGTQVLAANAGKVLKAVYDTAYGNYILIDHGGGRATLYAHLSKMKVKVGDTVKRGQVIGLSGSTGYSTGPHLHFEIRINGKTVNPLDYFK